MELLLIGLLIFIFGCSMVFAREFWWEMQTFTNQMRGQASERTIVWDSGQIIVGVIAIVLSIILMVQGGVKLSQPVVPKVCTALIFNEPPSVQSDITIGCEAAKKKDYQTALAHFRQAAKQTNRANYNTNFRRSLNQAIVQLEQVGKPR